MAISDIHFHDRVEAGRRLAEKLKKYDSVNYGTAGVVVYGLPRGGVIVAAEVARKLNAPLKPAFVRKIGHPNHREYAIGAVAEDGTFVGSREELEKIDPVWLEGEVKREIAAIKERQRSYFGADSGTRGIEESPRGKIAILVDDGIATGFTMLAGARMLRKQDPAKLILAVPVMPKEAEALLRTESDEVVTLFTDPYFLGAVGAYYDQFDPVGDGEVIKAFSSFGN